MKLQLGYEIVSLAYVRKLQITHLIQLKTTNIVSYNKFSKPGPGRFLGLTPGSTAAYGLPVLYSLVGTTN